MSNPHKPLRLALLVFGFAAIAALPVAAQPPETPPASEQGADSEAADEQTIDQILAGEEEVLSGEGFSYDTAGRRDPFISLLQRTQAKDLPQQRPEGVPGLLIDEIEIKGIFELNSRVFAQVHTSAKDKSYLIQEGDQLYDGEVVSIANGEVTFKQVVNDPSVIKPFREVVKKLNPEP